MTAPRFARLIGAHGELVLSNREQGRDSKFWLSGIDGYFGGVGISAPVVDRQLGHGAFSARATRIGRVLTLRGRLKFPDDETRLIADRFLSGLLWDGDYGTLEVTTGDLVLSCSVRLDGEVKHQYVVNTKTLDVEVPLYSPDPRLYAPERAYQVFPAGAGEGLEYNLFAAGPHRSASGESLFSFSSGAPGTRGELTDNSTGLTAPTTSVSTSVSGTVGTVPVKPGESYLITVYLGADKAGSRSAFAYRFNTVHTASVYFPTGGSNVTIDAPTETTRFQRVITASPGVSSMIFTFWGNHSTGGVKDAQQTLGVRVEQVEQSLGWGAQAPSGGAFANSGNTDSHPVFVVNGSWPAGFRITTEGRVIEYPSPVDPAHPVTIDNLKGSVLVAGIDQTYRLTRREWVKVPAGESIQPTVEGLAPSSGWCDVKISDTYI